MSVAGAKNKISKKKLKFPLWNPDFVMCKHNNWMLGMVYITCDAELLISDHVYILLDQ